MGVLPQDPYVFDTTIMDNVRYARPESSDEAVVEACKAAAIHEKILSFANNYHTRVGERGVRLSEGEKQQIAVARVFLKNPSILLLEESTCLVDSAYEHLLQSSLQRLMAGRTSFTIAQRYETS